jgi:hypothetical protein
MAVEDKEYIESRGEILSKKGKQIRELQGEVAWRSAWRMNKMRMTERRLKTKG